MKKQQIVTGILAEAPQHPNTLTCGGHKASVGCIIMGFGADYGTRGKSLQALYFMLTRLNQCPYWADSNIDLGKEG